MGERNFQAARRIGSRLNPPVAVTAIEKTQEVPGLILVKARIEKPTIEFWERLRKRETRLPIPQLSPISPLEQPEPLDDYSHLKSNKDNV